MLYSVFLERYFFITFKLSLNIFYAMFLNKLHLVFFRLLSQKLLLFLILLLLPDSPLQAQSNSLINYGREQGFSASNGYCLYQDHHGYLWIGTENGLLRFNGNNFKSYTTSDGLPDNEILTIVEDEKERLWLNPYSNAVCYIKQGKIHNAANDTLVKQLGLKENLRIIFKDRYGNLWFCGSKYLIQLDRKDRIKKIETIGGYKFQDLSGCTFLNSDNELVVLNDRVIYKWDNAIFKDIGYPPRNLDLNFIWHPSFIYDWKQKKLHFFHHDNGKIVYDTLINAALQHDKPNCSLSDGNYLYTCSDIGVMIIDIYTGRLKAHLLQDQKVGSILKANDGTIWLGTIGKGIYRLSETPVKSIEQPKIKSSIVYIKGTSQGVDYFDDRGLCTKVHLSGQNQNISTSRHQIYSGYRYIGRNQLKQWIISTGYIKLYKNFEKKLLKQFDMLYIKSAIEEDKDHLLLATTSGMYRLHKNRFKITDTFFFNERVLSVAKIGNVIYAGMLTGLSAIYPDGSYKTVSKGYPNLRTHITALTPGKDNMLWVADNKSELVGVRRDSVVVVVDFKKGLHCNNIYCIEASANFVWVGTDNGLFAISQSPPYNIIQHITYANGLNSNQVNCLSIYQKKIWAGTLKGVNYFTEDDAFKMQEKSKIVINDIKNGANSLLPSDDVLFLKHKSLVIDFDILDFSGSARPGIQYRIDQEEWVNIDNSKLTFPEVATGNFTLEIRTISSKIPEHITFRQTFYHPPPFYFSWWFQLSAFAAISGLVTLLFLYLNSRSKRKYLARLNTQQNLLRLEQMALQSQMNPHFIFNCIAAIKQYYRSGNILKGDNFTDVFAQLIRQTFEMTSATFISMDKELSYLSQYLNIEQTRFNHTFEYTIVKQTVLPISQIKIPAMLLQPIVENAIRHGIRHLVDRKGIIEISITQQLEQIEINIKDNGIGRQKSKALQANNYIQYAFTSGVVNNKRIQILNQLFNGNITMTISDIVNNTNDTIGTQVFISYPTWINKILVDENYNS